MRFAEHASFIGLTALAASLTCLARPRQVVVTVVTPPAPAPTYDPELIAPPRAADLDWLWKTLPPGKEVLSIALPRATIETTRGTLHCTLVPFAAPTAVANFIGLATGRIAWRDPLTGRARADPFYDGVTFHRVIPGFMIQAGDRLGRGTYGPGYTFDDEISPELKFAPGRLAMANRGPNTNGSQFFITDGETSYLDGHYTIFGQCGDLDVVHAIASVPRDAMDKPTTPVTITRVTLTAF
jgi:peptidyl-prolyl cis-trans isomerase A (cyclophilin A)